MPTHSRYQPRGWGILGGLLEDILGMRYEYVAVEWELVRYVDDVA
jgi:hypothetical protein